MASVIAGATTPEQVAQNAQAGQAWRLTAADLASLPAGERRTALLVSRGC